MRPRERRTLGRTARRVWVFVHVAVSVGWMGAGAANLVLAASALRSPDGAIPAVVAYRAIHTLDTWLVIPAAFAALISGVVLSLGTVWGLVRHWWVLVKLVLTVAVIVFATLGIGVWVEWSLIDTPALGPGPHAVRLVVGAAANLVAFVTMIALSVWKPRGVTPWAADRARVDRARTDTARTDTARTDTARGARRVRRTPRVR